ncbi:hypothetical protein B0H14DRAFT_2655524 [Mycena olivaceomarginata]|nr:hypothetical protein B0H14DRAFT_2655524 [Mycena olivaceomarginata]
MGSPVKESSTNTSCDSAAIARTRRNRSRLEQYPPRKNDAFEGANRTEACGSKADFRAQAQEITEVLDFQGYGASSEATECVVAGNSGRGCAWSIPAFQAILSIARSVLQGDPVNHSTGKGGVSFEERLGAPIEARVFLQFNYALESLQMSVRDRDLKRSDQGHAGSRADGGQEQTASPISDPMIAWNPGSKSTLPHYLLLRSGH